MIYKLNYFYFFLQLDFSFWRLFWNQTLTWYSVMPVPALILFFSSVDGYELMENSCSKQCLCDAEKCEIFLMPNVARMSLKKVTYQRGVALSFWRLFWNQIVTCFTEIPREEANTFFSSHDGYLFSIYAWSKLCRWLRVNGDRIPNWANKSCAGWEERKKNPSYFFAVTLALLLSCINQTDTCDSEMPASLEIFCFSEEEGYIFCLK